MTDFAAAAETFIREHHVWAGVLVGLLTFAESLAFVSFFVPATAILIAAGGLVGAGMVPLLDLVVGGVAGCLVGDTVSYWLGRRLGPHADRVWPFRTRPEMLAKGNAFFARHGWWGVFAGRFFGPLRAVVPLSAGIMGMRHGLFQGVSFGSALLFVPAMLAPGAVVAKGAEHADSWTALPALTILGTPILIGGYFLAKKMRARTGG
ncbi:DedA family protein [Prosthecomicrobium sp. N25]|uniref:DedA family protein n=1 Tax=Prosthecomicrobium sp. N25 TaxID=3129254 RepID=UPI0030775DAB